MTSIIQKKNPLKLRSFIPKPEIITMRYASEMGRTGIIAEYPYCASVSFVYMPYTENRK